MNCFNINQSPSFYCPNSEARTAISHLSGDNTLLRDISLSANVGESNLTCGLFDGRRISIFHCGNLQTSH